MKPGDSNPMTISIVAGIVLCFTVPTKSQTSAAKYDFDEFPIPVETADQDFVVKFKGEMISWRNLSQLLRQHNITVPQEKDLLAAVQKGSSTQSCKGRCFLDERKYSDKTCFCDTACKTFSDCCLDFHSRCRKMGNDVSLQNLACGDVNEYSWSGVIMKPSCSSHGSHGAHVCQTVQQLNMTLQKELPVFDGAQNVTYRSIGCARCNSEGNLSYWGLDISCAVSSGSIATPVNIMAVKTFLKEHPDCSWKYAPRNRNQRYESCVLPDTQCASSQLGVLSVVKQLCSLYSMAFSFGKKITYRNPHCALCNPDGRRLVPFGFPTIVPPLSILLDVSANILDQREPNTPRPTQVLITGSPITGYNLTAQVFNCTSNTTNCTVIFGNYTCENLTSRKNQSTQIRFYLNKSHAIIPISQKQILHEKNAGTLQGNTVYIVCPERQNGRGGQVDKEPSWHDSAVLIYLTFSGSLLSIVSLCCLLSIYLSFKELRNLPGKCLINLSLALLSYQANFLGAAKSKEIDTLCKAVAIFLHFFLLAAFSWMSIIAFDTASTFTVQVNDVRRQPSDIRKTFIKYCIVGWGLPAVVVALSSVLDFSEALAIGYGNSTYCWISDKRAIAIVMVTPVSLALLFNVMCLAKNIYAIHHLQQGARQATNNSSRAPLTLICIKLTTIMGLAWILGLLANWKRTAFLQYPSTVLNSMQGFFIALCFITTKKVRGLLKNGFSRLWNGAVEPETRFTGNTDVETTAVSSTFNMKSFSKENARPETFS